MSENNKQSLEKTDIKAPLKTSTDLARRIRIERTKRNWTQAELAKKAGVSARTVQRIECGLSAAPETLRLLTDAFGIRPDELTGKNSQRLSFKAPYAKSLTRTFTVFSVIWIIYSFALCPVMCGFCGMNPAHVLAFFAAFTMINFLNCFVMPISFSIKKGKLVVQHFIFATRYDLSALTNIELRPDAMMGAMPLSFPIIISSAWYRSALLGTFRAFVNDEANTVLMEFGKKKILVSPDDPAAFVTAIQESVQGICAGENTPPNDLP
jgi:transcriptional regulator with XRE-family HTH domain